MLDERYKALMFSITIATTLVCAIIRERKDNG